MLEDKIGMRMSQVSLTQCDSYEPTEITSSLKKCLDQLGGLGQFVKPGQTVLIKPNALLGETPDHAVTTHPALIKAVVKAVVKAGGIAWVGDSPGNAHSNVSQTMEETGIKAAAEQAGGQLVYFQQDGVSELSSPSHNARMPRLRIAKKVLEADVIINLPKLKTHGLTLYTGAIKNMFGSVPGFHKSSFHTTFPKAKDFAEAIVDIFQLTRPALNIMDAVVGMEGAGPSNGQPRKMRLLLASADGVALDAVGSYLIGYDPVRILTTRAAFRRGLGEIDLDKIEIMGPDIGQFRQADWKKSFNNLGLIGSLPDWLLKLAEPILDQVRIYPVIDQARCTKCLVCVNNCPTKTINYDRDKKKVEIDKKDCISCFCCHELCEYDAIRLERSWLVRLLKLG